MPRSLASISAELEALTEVEFVEDLGMDKLYQLCDQLEGRSDGPKLIPAIFRTMERLKDADLGSPGPLVHTLESWQGKYEDHLKESIRRQPMYLTVWMVNRILNSEQSDPSGWIELLRQVTKHPKASVEMRSEADAIIKLHL